MDKPYDRIYLAAADYRHELAAELAYRGQRITDIQDRLVFAKGKGGIAAWAQNSWLQPVELPAPSISKAAQALRDIQRNWLNLPLTEHRRAQLIANRLPRIRFQPVGFPADPPSAPLGAWTLIEHDRMIASPRCSNPFPHGEVHFVEDKTGPPNRAYLKLWEALTFARRRPTPGERCIDLGAAPGGWTWVLAQLGAQVLAVDRAALDPKVAALANVEQRPGDAFTIDPESVGPVDWICSDVIAYPERLLELAQTWAGAHPEAGMIVTVKCQGDPAPELMARFLEIPGSRLMHLWHNKHELTWFRLPEGGPPEAAA